MGSHHLNPQSTEGSLCFPAFQKTHKVYDYGRRLSEELLHRRHLGRSATSCTRAQVAAFLKHRPDVQILRLCPGLVQYSMLFLEVIGDLLEKQEALGLLVYTLTFLFLNSFHLSQSQDVLRIFLFSPALQASSSSPPPSLASSLFIFPLAFCSLLHPPPITAAEVGNRCGVLVM